MGWKGGIGTASRLVGDHVLAVLLLANFGQWDRLTVGAVPVGRILGRSGLSEPSAPPSDSGAAVGPHGSAQPSPAGSCIGVVVTDAPLDARACGRLARRVGLGLARAGSTAHHGSGEIFLGLSTGHRAARGARPAGPGLGGADLDPLFEACVDAAEEAVLDALLNATDTVGHRGRRALALPHDALREALAGR